MSKIKSLNYFNEQYQQFILDMDAYLKGNYNTIVEIFGGGSKRGPLYTLYFTPSNKYWRFLTKRELDNKLLDKLEKIGCGFNVDSDKVTFFIKSNNKKDAFEINGNKNWFRQLSRNEDFKEMLNSIPITFVEIKPYSYKGQIITANSKEEAINKIIAEKSTQTETVNSAVVRFTFEDPFMNNHNFEEKINLGKAVSKKDALILAKKELLNGIDIKNDEVGGRFNNYQIVTLSYKGQQLGKWKDNPPFNKFAYNGSAYTNSRKDRLIEIKEIRV